jgi:hypothetical protein
MREANLATSRSVVQKYDYPHTGGARKQQGFSSNRAALKGILHRPDGVPPVPPNDPAEPGRGLNWTACPSWFALLSTKQPGNVRSPPSQTARLAGHALWASPQADLHGQVPRPSGAAPADPAAGEQGRRWAFPCSRPGMAKPGRTTKQLAEPVRWQLGLPSSAPAHRAAGHGQVPSQGARHKQSVDELG